jgi:hypothetical protein
VGSQVFGGIDPDTGEDVNDIFLFDLTDLEHPRWVPLHSPRLGVSRITGQLPGIRNAACAAAYGAEVIIFGGGRYGVEYNNDVHVITFHVTTPIPPPISSTPLEECSPVSPGPAASPADSAKNGEPCPAAMVQLVLPGGGSRHVLRQQLAVLSSVMTAWLFGGFDEGRRDTITLPDIFSGEVWGAFLDYVEGKGLQLIDESRLLDFLRLADMYELTHLRGLCERELVGSITAAQVGDVLELAANYHCPLLLQHCLLFLERRVLTAPDRRAALAEALPGLEGMTDAAKEAVARLVDPFALSAAGEVEWVFEDGCGDAGAEEAVASSVPAGAPDPLVPEAS